MSSLSDDDQGSGFANVSGLAAEWESVRDIRALVRESGSVITNEPGKYIANETVEGFGVNLHLLLPVMRRLMQKEADVDDHESTPSIAIVSIPQVEEELLHYSLKQTFTFCFVLVSVFPRHSPSPSWHPTCCCLYLFVF